MSVILTKRVLFVSVKAPKIVHETKRVNSFDKTEKIKCQDLLTRFNYINDLFFFNKSLTACRWGAHSDAVCAEGARSTERFNAMRCSVGTIIQQLINFTETDPGVGWGGGGR